VIPTKNDEETLERCLRSIKDLDFPREEYEVIIVDGYSSDRTVEVANLHGYKVVYEDFGTRGGACNVGVKNARGEFIVFTDADCVVPKNWLHNLLIHFSSENTACVGGPNITPEDDTTFAKCVGAVLSFLSKPGSRYGLNVGKLLETFHNSGCNAAYRKKAIEEANWFNEKLVTCEDEELDYRVREKGYRILYVPDARVDHYRRSTWKRFFRQAYRYAVGRAQGIKLYRKMGRWFHFIPSVSMSVISFLFVLSLVDHTYLWLASSLLVGGALGILLISLYLAAKTRLRIFYIFFGLIALWYLGFGVGLFRGFLK